MPLPFKAVTYQQSAQANNWLKGHQEAPLVIQVNEQTRLSQLFDNIHISSEKKVLFGRRQSGLQVALHTGKPAVFRGLESNSTLQQRLESLVCGQPLLVNGRLQAYPKARITLLWPEGAKSPSRLWDSVISAGRRCPEADIWDISSAHHAMSRAHLPEQAINQLYEAFKQKVRKSPELQRLEEKDKNGKLTKKEADLFSGLKKQCRDAPMQAFSHYLYQMTHTKGSRLTCCWTYQKIYRVPSYGAHEPSSPEEHA